MSKKKVEMFTEEMAKEIFLFQPALSTKFSASGKSVMKSVSQKQVVRGFKKR